MAANDPSPVLNLFTLPQHCEYADGPCDQNFSGLSPSGPFFIYPSTPTAIAATIEGAIKLLKSGLSTDGARSWKQLPIAGHIIFCEVCKALRAASTVVADVTTLNFNLLFEIGFAIGLDRPIIPIRDVTYARDKLEFAELGILDVLGYVDFTNSDELARKLRDRLPGTPLPPIKQKSFHSTPLYVLKGRIQTEGAVRLMSTIKKSALSFRTYDPIETPRLPLSEARKQVAGSLGIIAHLLSPHRDGAIVHNGLCALLCGIAVAQQKVVAMLQEERVQQPIDYRDIVQPYTHPDDIAGLLQRAISGTVRAFQQTARLTSPVPANFLERIDLGDTAAENEITGLREYFVRTGQFTQAKQGHGRLVVGRKGSGKTAIFYGVRDSVPRSPSHLMLDLKPEGHQFALLRETVLDRVSAGLQEHTMTAFWNYLLLTEAARKIVYTERHHAYGAGRLAKLYDAVSTLYTKHDCGPDEDFPQRLLALVERAKATFGGVAQAELANKVTEWLYARDIHDLSNALSAYLKEKESVWLLIDNIDKGWPTRGATSADIVVVRSLLEATRKLQRQLQAREVDFKCLVFIRTDIYEHLLQDTSDRGKDTAITLDWDDVQVFQEIVRRRIEESTGASGTFREIWPQMVEPHLGAEDSFNWILARTLMRPRDLLTFLHRAIVVALNRGHSIVSADDLREAEKGYSEDLLLITAFEIGDTHRELRDLLYAFEHGSAVLTREDLARIINSVTMDLSQVDLAIDLLLWFGFLGVFSHRDQERYAYQVNHNIQRLKVMIEAGGLYVVHPGFRAALTLN